ncbi:MAG: hypothetical protein JWM49_2576 [Microbacteriaceae bacterium]|nr:hypothetical protein [Microbacteriaceae bacterium]
MTTKTPGNRALRAIGGTIKVIALTILALVIYFICDDLFGGYPQFHSTLITWILLLGFMAFGLVMWIVDERRHLGDDD